MTFTGINHLAMVTGDMDRTVRFWRDLLGMRLVAGLGDGKKYRHYFFEISPTDMIAFFEWGDVETRPVKDHGVPVAGQEIFDHVSLGVARDEDLWDLKERLESADYWVSEVIDHGFIRSIYTFDPNNIPIEFSVETGRVDLRKTPKMKDRKPSMAAREGSEPRPGQWPEVEKPIPASERFVFPGEGTILTENDG